MFPNSGVSLPRVTMDSKKLALLCRDLADNKKAENLLVLDVRKLSSVTDFFVLATGTSMPHVRAIVEAVTDGLRKDHDLRPRVVDGSPAGGWVVLDYFDVLIHVMHAATRERYDLESLCGDAPAVKPRKTKTVVEK